MVTVYEEKVCPKCGSAFCLAQGPQCRTLPATGEGVCGRCGSARCLTSGGAICRHTGLIRSWVPAQAPAAEVAKLLAATDVLSNVDERLSAWRAELEEAGDVLTTPRAPGAPFAGPKPAPAPGEAAQAEKRGPGRPRGGS